MAAHLPSAMAIRKRPFYSIKWLLSSLNQDRREPCKLSLSSLSKSVSTTVLLIIIFPEISNILKKSHIFNTKLYEFNQSQFQAETW